jgi:iron complex outermembrane receptor protein
MSASKRTKIYWIGTSSTLVLASLLAGQAAFAADSSTIETIVVTGTHFNPESAPAKASLSTTEPQTIINRSYIEDSIAPTSDYVSILAIVPSMTGLDINGPGMSDGNVKNTLRGMPDGNFGMTYDSIPFGDTNGPTHHSESYFPGSTIGSINVERGPGNAGNLGASTYGGSVNMYSEALSDDFHLRVKGTFGSWDTTDKNINVQSGDLGAYGLGHTRVLVNYQDTQSAGYLTLQNNMRDNELLKIENEIAPGWVLTLFANRSNLHQHANDNNGSTPAQVVTYGKQFGLQRFNPNLSNYYAYNYQNKITDMDYVRLRGEAFGGIKIDDEAYTYAYVNKTVTTTNVTQTLANITANTMQGLGTKYNGVSYPTDIPGYTKLNAYRVWGNILRASKDFEIGSVTGELRVGLWWESQATERKRYYFDMTQCFASANGCAPFAQPGLFADTKTSKGTVYNGVAGVGYIEHSGWQQLEPFAELEIHPIDGLTITPGIKYIDWKHTFGGPVIAGTSPLGPYNGAASSFTTSRTLPFATVNYRISESWSTYFQYAQGIYIPDISAFEVNLPVTFPKAETTTNYQFGTVYYADEFTFDADIYYIGVDNNYSFVDCGTIGGTSGSSCAVNTGKAFYRGVEGEGTYAFGSEAWGGLLDGLSVFANGSINSAQSGGLQLSAAPLWTSAGGLIYKHNGYRISLIDKVTGQQWVDNGHIDRNGVSSGSPGYLGAFYSLGAYNSLDMTGGYDFERYSIVFSVNNLLDSRSLVSVKKGDKPTIANPLTGASVNDLAGRPTSLDQYYFQPSRSLMITFKANF